MGQFLLARMYETGRGAPVDLDRSLDLYHQSATAGNALSQFNLGLRFYTGKGGTKHLPEAFRWIERSASSGHVPAQEVLGLMYRNGEGVDKNIAKSIEWLSLAAQGGNDDAQTLLGLMYLDGTEVTRDHQKAAKFFTNGALRDNKISQYMLGVMYLKGAFLDDKIMNPKSGLTGRDYLALGLQDFSARMDAQTGRTVYRYIDQQRMRSQLLSKRQASRNKRKIEHINENFIHAYMWLSVSLVNGYSEARDLMRSLEAQMSSADITVAQSKASQWMNGIRR